MTLPSDQSVESDSFPNRCTFNCFSSENGGNEVKQQ